MCRMSTIWHQFGTRGACAPRRPEGSACRARGTLTHAAPPRVPALFRNNNANFFLLKRNAKNKERWNGNSRHSIVAHFLGNRRTRAVDRRLRDL